MPKDGVLGTPYSGRGTQSSEYRYFRVLRDPVRLRRSFRVPSGFLPYEAAALAVPRRHDDPNLLRADLLDSRPNREALD